LRHHHVRAHRSHFRSDAWVDRGSVARTGAQTAAEAGRRTNHFNCAANQSSGDSKAPRPAIGWRTGGSGLVTTHGDYRRVVTNWSVPARTYIPQFENSSGWHIAKCPDPPRREATGRDLLSAICGATLTAPQSHCLTAEHVICGCVLPRRPGNRKIWNGKPKLRTVNRNRVPKPTFRTRSGFSFWWIPLWITSLSSSACRAHRQSSGRWPRRGHS